MREAGAVVVGGALANKAGSGGEAWVRLSWIRGLQRLGLDVWFVEELGVPDDRRIAYFRGVTERFGLADRATLLVGAEAAVGPPVDALLDVAASATLVNISGHLSSQPLFGAFARRVFVDIDPGFTQIWHAQGNPGARVDGHDAHVTIAENIGQPGCSIPTAGIDWLTVRQPVVLDDWPVAPPPDEPARFTTIANWRGPFGPLEFDGRRYGLKVHEFRKLLELPRKSPHAFELALNIHPGDEQDRLALVEHGWRLTDPGIAAEPEGFRQFVRRSGAELSVAQGVYVDTASGWFSDRTVRYLASGRPAVVQDTGFTRTLPAGEGLLTFRTLDDALAAADDVAARWDDHAAAARAFAERHFDSDRVLARFCEHVEIG
ncbi:MAG: glycosyltransferase [Acidimicrobiales bacterium]